MTCDKFDDGLVQIEDTRYAGIMNGVLSTNVPVSSRSERSSRTIWPTAWVTSLALDMTLARASTATRQCSSVTGHHAAVVNDF